MIIRVRSTWSVAWGLAAVLALGACSAATEPTPSEGTTVSQTPATPPPSSTAGPTASPSSTPAATDDLPSDLNQALRDAATNNDVALARRLIDAGADVNAKNDQQESAYLLAASEGAPEVLALTLANGAEVNDKDRFDGTALIRAAERGHYDVCGLLLQAGIDKDHTNRLGWQAIHEAVWLGDGDERYQTTVRVLVAGGVQVDQPDRDNNLTPLQMARSKEQSEVAATLELAGGEPGDAVTGLLRDAEAGNADGVAVALRAGADLESRNSRQRTALLLASAADRVPAARVLVALGADPDAVDDQQDTPWLVTGVTGSVEMAQVLLAADPDLAARNRYGGISIIPASERGHVEYVRWVTANTDIDVNHVNDLGWTALLEAVILGDGSEPYQQIVQILLAAGADRTIADADGVSALQHAERRGFTEIADLLRG